MGSRFAGVGDYVVHGPRRWAMRLLSVTLSRIVGTPLTDPTSGFRMVNGRALSLFAFDFPEEYLGDTVEALVLASRARLRIAQVPVAMRERTAGGPQPERLPVLGLSRPRRHRDRPRGRPPRADRATRVERRGDGGLTWPGSRSSRSSWRSRHSCWSSSSCGGAGCARSTRSSGSSWPADGAAPFFPGALARASGLLGIAVPSNLLFLVSLLILFGVSLQLSVEVGVLEEQCRRLAEEVGALRLRLEDLEWRTRIADQAGDGAGSTPPSEQGPDEAPVAANEDVDSAGRCG